MSTANIYITDIETEEVLHRIEGMRLPVYVSFTTAPNSRGSERFGCASGASTR